MPPDPPALFGAPQQELSPCEGGSIGFLSDDTVQLERLGHRHCQSDRKLNVTQVLKKDESFKWGTFTQGLSYHINNMTSYTILHETE